MSTHNIYLWRNNENINTFGVKKHLIRRYINSIVLYIQTGKDADQFAYLCSLISLYSLPPYVEIVM